MINPREVLQIVHERLESERYALMDYVDIQFIQLDKNIRRLVEQKIDEELQKMAQQEVKNG